MIYRVKRTDTYRSIGAQFGQMDEVLVAAELAAANPCRACLVDGLPTLLGGLRVGEPLNLPKMWDLDTPRAWGTMREGASESSHNGDWGAGVMDRGIRIPERGLKLDMRLPPVAPAMDLELDGVTSRAATLADGPETLGAAHPGENAPGQGGTHPTQYFPEDWDLVNNTYTIPDDDPSRTYTAAQLVYFAGVENYNGSPNYVHAVACPDEPKGASPGSGPCVFNGVAKTGNPDWDAFWHKGAVIKLPQEAIDNVYALGCPDGYQRAPDGRNCVPIPGSTAKKPPRLAIGDTGSMWLLVGGVLAALGIGVAVSKAKKKRAA